MFQTIEGVKVFNGRVPYYKLGKERLQELFIILTLLECSKLQWLKEDKKDLEKFLKDYPSDLRDLDFVRVTLEDDFKSQDWVNEAVHWLGEKVVMGRTYNFPTYHNLFLKKKLYTTEDLVKRKGCIDLGKVAF